MRWTIPASACLLAAALVGCNKNRTNGAGETGSMSDTAATAAPAPSDTSGMSGMNRSADTGMRGMGTSDTAMRGTGMSDTSKMKSGGRRMHPDTSKPASNDSAAR